MNGKVKTAKLALDAIRLDAGIQTRAHIDDCTVAEYSEAMLRGDRFPPVVVFGHNGDLVLADGWHRVRAARRARLPHLTAEVHPGDRKDALRFALDCNQAHGLRRSNADKRRCAEIALAQFGNLSDRLLAEMCGVSVQTIGNVRPQLSNLDSSPPRLGKDGKVRTLPVRASSKPVRPARPAVVVEDAKVDDGSGAFMEVAGALVNLEALVERVAHNHPQDRPAVLAAIRKLRADLLNLEKQIAAE